MKNKIGFVLLSNSRDPIPSTRIAILNVLPYLSAAGFECEIVHDPDFPSETPDISKITEYLISSGFQLIVFQKVHGDAVEMVAQALANANIRTIYCVCDLTNIAMVKATDATIVVTEYLKSLYPKELESKINVVHDGIEHPENFKNEWSLNKGSRGKPLQAVLITSSALDRLPVIKSSPSWLNITIVGRYSRDTRIYSKIRDMKWMLAEQRGIRNYAECLSFLCHPRIRRLGWGPESVYEKMLNADIGIIPIETSTDPASVSPPMWKVKSENRLTMKMAVGLPVIATPIPSYERVIRNGQNGFFASERKTWFDTLETLRDPELRKTIGVTARSDVLKQFSISEQAKSFIDVINRIINL